MFQNEHVLMRSDIRMLGHLIIPVEQYHGGSSEQHGHEAADRKSAQKREFLLRVIPYHICIQDIFRISHAPWRPIKVGTLRSIGCEEYMPEYIDLGLLHT